MVETYTTYAQPPVVPASVKDAPNGHSLDQQKLKRLGSATSLAATASTQAELLYKKARALTPSFLEPSIARVEETVATAAAPVVAKAQDAGDKLLHFADNRVDYAMLTADQVLNTTKSGVSYGLGSLQAIHQSGMQTFGKTSEKYFERISKAADWVAELLNPVKGVQVARATLASALETAKAATDPDVAVQMGTDAWHKFAAHPAVAKLLNTAEPVTNLGYQAFVQLHDTLVTSPLYKATLDTTASTLGWATTSTPYRLGAQLLYPWVQPVADPALETFNKSKVVHQLVDYWKPTKSVHDNSHLSVLATH